MRAIQVKVFGGPEGLALGDLPTPDVGAGQALVAVEAAGVGLVDVLMRRGLYPGSKPGLVPGIEVVGSVLAVGPGVDPTWLHRRVLALVQGGGYAERVVVQASALMPLPSHLGPAEALALGANALVARFSLRHARLKAGERVLVRGASGGIGIWATVLAAQAGATVAVATSSPERGQRLARLGAAQVLDRAGQWEGREPEGFDVIIDPVAGPQLTSFLGKLKDNGRLVLCGVAGGYPPADFGMGLLSRFQKSLSLSTLSLNSVSAGELVTEMSTLFGVTVPGGLKTLVQDTLSFEHAAKAHVLLEAGEVFGKIVLTP